MALLKPRTSLPAQPDPLHPEFSSRFAACSENLRPNRGFSPRKRRRPPGQMLVPGGHELAEAADQPCSSPRNIVPCRPAQGADGAPGFGCLEPCPHLDELSVRPGKRRNPHQLVTREMKQSLDQHEL